MPRTDTLTCTCCQLPRSVREGAQTPFVCQSCRPHVGSSLESRARRAETHAGYYWAMWEGAERQAKRLRDRLDRAGYKIESLRTEVAELRGAQDDAPELPTLIERLRALHHVELRTGKCSCGQDARCPTLRLAESA